MVDVFTHITLRLEGGGDYESLSDNIEANKEKRTLTFLVMRVEVFAVPAPGSLIAL